MTLQPIHPDHEFPTTIPTLGPCRFPSPVRGGGFVANHERVLYDLDAARTKDRVMAGEALTTFERAGPRAEIFFEPKMASAALVTCGGLCPGVNDVVRAIVHELHFVYGVERIRGVRFGYAGLNPNIGLPMIDLTPDVVRNIHEDGGTFLGSSRGPQRVDIMVDTLVRERIDILFAIGGDGTLRGALALHEEILRRGLSITVVGVPKTIDNDINLVSRSFGFQTAVAEAVQSIRCAHTEAEGVDNGIGIVKLMGRKSGFIAAHASLAQGDVNFVLVPEVPFELEGPAGFLAALGRRMVARHHAVIVVAEGAGQGLFDAQLGTDESGNSKLGDIGVLLKAAIAEHFEAAGIDAKIKYIDPSYMIRSVPADANDCAFCVFLGQHAVHAAMAGKTGMLMGSWNNVFVHIPIEAAVQRRKQLDARGVLWRAVLESTGQPERMVNS